MFLYDPKTQYNIEFLSKRFRIAVTAQFIEDITDLKINYNVIRK